MTSQVLYEGFIDDTENASDEMAFRLFNSLSNEIYLIDARDYSLVRANRGALRGCEYVLSDLQERPFSDLAPAMTSSKCSECFARLINGEEEVLELETVFRRKSGVAYPVSMKLQYFDDLCPPVIVVVAQDETDGKKAEDLSNRFGRIFETSLNEIYVFDGETCNFIHVNEGARRNLGYSMEEMERLTAWEIKPEIEEPQFREIVQPLLNGDVEVLQFETIHQRKDGTRYPVEVHLQLFADETPSVFVAIILDISERKRAEDLNNRFGRIFETSLNEIYIFDCEDCNFVHVNEGARRNLGYSMEEMQALTAWAIKPEIEEPQFREIIQPLIDGDVEVLQFETVHQRKNGTCYPVEVHVQLFGDETPSVFVAIILDISERKETEAAILKLNQDLEKRVEQRTAELENTNGELMETLESLKRTQTQLVESEKMASLGGLVAGIAHEINTPVGIGVTAISHLREESEILEKSFQQGSMKRSDLEAYIKKSNEAVTIIESNLRRASDLIRSFKNVAVDQMSEEPREFALAGYLEEILMSLRPNLKQGGHKIELECDPSIRIFSQPGVFSQIVTNLVMNSLIHAFDEGESGQMSLSVHQGEGEVEICY